jgi:hypothetical protein
MTDQHVLPNPYPATIEEIDMGESFICFGRHLASTTLVQAQSSRDVRQRHVLLQCKASRQQRSTIGTGSSQIPLIIKRGIRPRIYTLN